MLTCEKAKEYLLCKTLILVHGDPEALVLQEWSLQMVQQFIDGVNVGVIHSKPWIWAWAWTMAVLFSLPSLHQGQLSKLCPGKGPG